MATLTIPHHRFQSAGELKRGTATAWRKVKSGKSWQNARDCFGWQGDIRALEVTHGRNGWHPHLHVLIFFKPGTSKDTMYGFGGWLYDAWASSIERLGFGSCSKDAFTWETVKADNGAGAYVGKWGAAMELTKGHTKRGRSGRTPWQILADFAESGNATDAALFQEYASSFKGARQLTWSRDLRALYAADPEATDAALADEPTAPETQTATLSRSLFDAIVKRGLTADVLSGQEHAGLKGVLDVLTRHQIPWRIGEMHGLEAGLLVPLIELKPLKPPSTASPKPVMKDWRKTVFGLWGFEHLSRDQPQ